MSVYPRVFSPSVQRKKVNTWLSTVLLTRNLKALFQFPVSFSCCCVPHLTSFYSTASQLIYEKSSRCESPEESRAGRKDPEESCPGENPENCSHLHSHHGVRISLLCSLSEPRMQTFACGQFWWVCLHSFILSCGFFFYYSERNKEAKLYWGSRKFVPWL